ncbi:AGE family epimerase/isomerase [Flavivirga abyssicola]|uniref:AGE family epimerase/isomerase n=1 Tax=Flavivirga abyssicola TaxID=3063533 RepID=UPI0026E0A83F|nr:AGE family epimerase/isomerase [Flavivirga sp. MEBiC07777]WVK12582.1 AGE family epimerase/isomerase [Flavivirga sp. MEBiC07777]
MITAYETLKLELDQELKNILNYWSQNTLDETHGGFVGEIDYENNTIDFASKGIILNTRILWAFSAASNYYNKPDYKHICDRSYEYIKRFFNDEKYGGVFWELDYKGQPINTRKQIYAQSFAIYALSEYYLFTKKEAAKTWAIELFKLIEKHARDTVRNGYTEAFNEDWSPIEDMRLSDKDMNVSKTMNTHLHILEAYTNLLRIYNSEDLKSALKNLIRLIQQKFLNENYHYDLFFDDNWNLKNRIISYGHDIETIWLVIDAAKAIGDKHLIEQTENTAIKVANTFLNEGIDEEGAVINEKNLNTDEVDSDRHWWPQMEALVGLKYVFYLTKDTKYIEASLNIWEFTKAHLIDKVNGEWHFRVDKNGNVYSQENKVSMWKAPYHTSRACILIQD